jgi:hypothetical protein
MRSNRYGLRFLDLLKVRNFKDLIWWFRELPAHREETRPVMRRGGLRRSGLFELATLELTGSAYLTPFVRLRPGITPSLPLP